MLKSGHKLSSANQPAGAFGPSQCNESLVSILQKQVRKASHATQHRTDCHETIIFAGQMGAYARPRPIRGMPDQPGTYGIQADVRDSCQQMRLIHRDRSEPALKKVTRPAAPRVDVIGITSMRFSDRSPKTICLRRTENEVNMVWHQTVRPNLDCGLACLFSQQISINVLVTVLKEDRLPAIATLRHVMREAGYHHASQSSHGENYHERSAGDRYPVPLSPSPPPGTSAPLSDLFAREVLIGT